MMGRAVILAVMKRAYIIAVMGGAVLGMFASVPRVETFHPVYFMISGSLGAVIAIIVATVVGSFWLLFRYFKAPRILVRSLLPIVAAAAVLGSLLIGEGAAAMSRWHTLTLPLSTAVIVALSTPWILDADHGHLNQDASN